MKFRLAVCKGPDCRSRGSDALVSAVQAALAAANLSGQCQVTRGGCYGLCRFGANIVIRPASGAQGGARIDPLSPENYRLMKTPGEVHYPAMTVEKIPELVRQHIGEGQPVEAFRVWKDD